MKIYYTLFDESQNQRDISRRLLKKVLLEHGYNPEDLTKTVGAHGKPGFKELPFDYNLSHTLGLAALCIGSRVGVDCEKIREFHYPTAKRVCSEEQLLKIAHSFNPQKEFMMNWTLKEAFSKMMGSGFRYSFKSIDVPSLYCVYPKLKIFQTELLGFVLTAAEEQGAEILTEKVDLLS